MVESDGKSYWVYPEDDGELALKEGLIDINKASKEELQLLNGIGGALADRIITYREEEGPFKEFEDLMKVPYLGPSTFERIKNYIKI